MLQNKWINSLKTFSCCSVFLSYGKKYKERDREYTINKEGCVTIALEQ